MNPKDEERNKRHSDNNVYDDFDDSGEFYDSDKFADFDGYDANDGFAGDVPDKSGGTMRYRPADREERGEYSDRHRGGASESNPTHHAAAPRGRNGGEPGKNAEARERYDIYGPAGKPRAPYSADRAFRGEREERVDRDKRESGERYAMQRREGGADRRGAYAEADGYRRGGSSAERRAPARKPSAKRRRRSTGLAVFYISALFVGILVCIVVFAIVFSTMKDEAENKAALEPTRTPGAVTDSPPVQEINKLLGIIKQTEPSVGQIILLDPAEGMRYSLKTSPATNMTDRRGAALTIGEFAPGDIVNVSYDVATATLTELEKSAQSWTVSNKKGVKINYPDKTITIDNDSYTYTDQIMVLYKNNPYDITAIQSSDIVTVSGVFSQAWCVILSKSHGYLEINNRDGIRNGVVEIGTDMRVALNTPGAIELPEGMHHIVVRGDNIEPYTRDVTILPNETLYIDPGDATVRTGMVNIIVNETDYALIIDGAEITQRGMLTLEYGTHTIRVEKADFNTIEQAVTIEQPVYDVMINLKKTLKMADVLINTTPNGADVYIDNVLVGKSPASAQVEMGLHTVTTVRDGYFAGNLTIEVNKENMMFQLDLTPREQQPAPTPDVNVIDTPAATTPAGTLEPSFMPDEPLPTMNLPAPTLDETLWDIIG